MISIDSCMSVYIWKWSLAVDMSGKYSQGTCLVVQWMLGDSEWNGLDTVICVAVRPSMYVLQWLASD